MKTTLLLAVFITIISQFMADEVRAWSGWLHKELRRRAVAKLPEKYRDRYDEEWGHDIEEVPGEIFKIFRSFGFLNAASGIRRATLEGTDSAWKFSDLQKRTFDIVFSAVLLIICAPPLLIIAAAVKLTSRGPIFYKSTRIGKHGREFSCLKFRTMTKVSPYEAKLTYLGRFLRSMSIDELPQLFNVLKGEMSIVGPAPQAMLIDQQSLEVAPGLTGLWQLDGDDSYSSLVTLDEKYTRDRSLWLDLKIILRSVQVLFNKRKMN